MSVSGIPVMGSYKEAVLRRLQRVEVNKWMYPTGRPVPRRIAAGRMSAQAGNDVPRGNRRGARPDPPTTSSPGLYPAMMKPLRPTAQHTSRLIRSNWPGVLSLNAAARSCRDADLTRFWLLLAAEWLPVERRLVVAKKAGARDDSCKLCGLGVETVRHLPVCANSAVQAQCRRKLSRALGVLRGAGIRVRRSLTAPALPAMRILTGKRGWVCWIPVWFDLQRRTWMEVALPEPVREGTAYLSPQDPLASEVGVMPVGIDRVLLGQRSANGCWTRRSLRNLAELKRSLQLSLLRDTFATYVARCQCMTAWWKSPAAATHRATRAEQRAQDSKARRQRRLRRAKTKFDERAAKRVVKGRSRGTGPRQIRPPGDRGKSRVPSGSTGPKLRRSKRIRRPIERFAPLLLQADCEEAIMDHLERLQAAPSLSLPWY